MAKKRKGDHVIYDSKTQEFHCLNCDKRYKPALPMPITMFCAAGKEFAKLHRNCEKKG